MGYREVVLKSESSRCLLCENAPCANACEHGVRIDRIIRSINFENQEGARYLLADNPCVSCIDGSCMQECNRAKFDAPVRIDKITELVAKEKPIAPKEIDLSTDLCGVKCENPFFLSSSVVGSNYEMIAKAFDEGWAGVAFKTIGMFTPNEVSPRFAELDKEDTAFVGFKNIEQISTYSLEENLEFFRKLKENYPAKVIIASIMGSNEEEWTKLASLCEKAGADGLAAINTIKSIMNVDLNSFSTSPNVSGKSSVGGYSGKAVKPIALRFINEMKSDERLKDIPISGMGGIETWYDAAEFISLGCSTVQVTTSVMQYGYRIIDDMLDGLKRYMSEHGFNSINDFLGKAEYNIIPADDLDRSYICFPSFDREKCVGCGRCYVSCFDGGHQAIKMNDKNKPVLLGKKCVGCHLCKVVCPVGAISAGKKVRKSALKKH